MEPRIKINTVDEPLPEADKSSEPSHHELSRWIILVFAVTCGLSVANIYYAQPLLDVMAADFAIDPAVIGLVVALTHVGYVVGLLLIVPLGDQINRRKLIICQITFSVLALAGLAAAQDVVVLFLAMIVVGMLAVVVQVIVAFTATLAMPHQQGHAVGLVTGGVVIGILAARFVSGMLADLGGWRAVYMASAGCMLIMAVLLFRVLPSHVPTKKIERYSAIVKSIPALFLQDSVLRLRGILAFFIFASFSTLWTAMVLPLSATPFSLSHTEIGLFGMVGLAGALAASGAGRLADRGFSRGVTGLSLILLTLSWLLIGLLPFSLPAFVLGVVLLDFAVQAVHVTNQSVIFMAHPEVRSRLVGGYMVFYSAGSGVGAIASTTLYAHFGWYGVSALGAFFSLSGLLFWVLLRGKSSHKT
ncbi:MFS transporter [Agrobacterium sp.]|jgi:predicted MFS family arabinose efflux permease|uniref:MFS transporter n=1 Tax=Agrobacterium sp. TaxID=361 RepID=UPI0028A91FE5|nr:MFS transporter [Agrobacterium sp.]